MSSLGTRRSVYLMSRSFFRCVVSALAYKKDLDSFYATSTPWSKTSSTSNMPNSYYIFPSNYDHFAHQVLPPQGAGVQQRGPDIQIIAAKRHSMICVCAPRSPRHVDGPNLQK